MIGCIAQAHINSMYTIDLHLSVVYKGGQLITNEDMIKLMNVLSAFRHFQSL